MEKYEERPVQLFKGIVCSLKEYKRCTFPSHNEYSKIAGGGGGSKYLCECSIQSGNKLTKTLHTLPLNTIYCNDKSLFGMQMSL